MQSQKYSLDYEIIDMFSQISSVFFVAFIFSIFYIYFFCLSGDNSYVSMARTHMKKKGLTRRSFLLEKRKEKGRRKMRRKPERNFTPGCKSESRRFLRGEMLAILTLFNWFFAPVKLWGEVKFHAQLNGGGIYALYWIKRNLIKWLKRW